MGRDRDGLSGAGLVATDVAELKARSRAAWSLGDYERLGRLLEPAAQELADACAVSAGQEVLDVAAGDGNFAPAAAREGASVVASDLSPGMVDRGRRRFEAEGYEADWVEADVEDLPFEDGRFDCAGSVFGAMFAPRPEVVAAEMFRVVRSGNTVGMASWCRGIVAMHQALGDDRFARLREDYLAFVREWDGGDGPVRIESEYLLVVAHKRG